MTSVPDRRGGRGHAIALGIVLLASLVLNLRNLSHPGLKPLDEVFHAIVARNFLRHPLTPTLADPGFLPDTPGLWQTNHIWLHKPPMTMWQIAISFAILGVKPLALRLPSALLAPAAAGLTYLIGLELLDRTAALAAAALQAFNPVILMLVHGLIFSDHVDISLLFWTECSILFLTRLMRTGKRSDAILCGIAQGLAFLSKTYPALLVTGLAAVALLLNTRITFRHLLTILIATAATALPWIAWIGLRFPDEFAYENFGILRHLSENVEGWAAPWDRVIFGYWISVFYLFYPAVLAATVLIMASAWRKKETGPRFTLAWAAFVLIPNLLATSKPMSATLIGWPAMWLIFGCMISRAMRGDRRAAGTWLAATLAAAIFIRSDWIPTRGWGGATGGFASIMVQQIWVVWITIISLVAGSALALIRSTPCQRTIVTIVSLATILLALRWWKGDHPRGYVCVAMDVTRIDSKPPPDFSVIGAFAQKLPTNAAFIVEEKNDLELENKLLEFAADRACYPANHNAPQLLVQLAQAGALPYLVSSEDRPFPVVLDDPGLGQKVYACDGDALAAAR